MSIASFYFLSCPDYKTGFGGKFGVQSDRKDKSAHGWEHHEKVDKHESQKGGFALSLLCLLFCIFLSFVQIIRQALVETLESRQTELTNLLWVGSTMSR